MFDIKFDEINLDVITATVYSKNVFVGSFDFNDIKGNIVGYAGKNHTDIELYAPADWFTKNSIKPFGISIQDAATDGTMKDFYRLRDIELYNDRFKAAAKSVDAAKLFIYGPIINHLNYYKTSEIVHINKKETNEMLSKGESSSVFIVEDHMGPADQTQPARVFSDKKEAEKAFKELFDSCKITRNGVEAVYPTQAYPGEDEYYETVSWEEALKKGEFSYCIDSELDGVGHVKMFTQQLDMIKNGSHLEIKEKAKALAELKDNKPTEIIAKKGKFGYDDYSKLGAYYYKLSVLKDDPLIPQYDKDRELVKEMLRDGLTDSRIQCVCMNIDDRKNIPHRNYAVKILREPSIKQYKTILRQKTRTMQKQR